jgi:predicted RNase H-like HicB family nuclease
MKYTIALQRSDEGVSVSVPGLPGCWSQGDTEPEALEHIAVAIHKQPAARDERSSALQPSRPGCDLPRGTPLGTGR